MRIGEIAPIFPTHFSKKRVLVAEGVCIIHSIKNNAVIFYFCFNIRNGNIPCHNINWRESFYLTLLSSGGLYITKEKPFYNRAG